MGFQIILCRGMEGLEMWGFGFGGQGLGSSQVLRVGRILPFLDVLDCLKLWKFATLSKRKLISSWGFGAKAYEFASDMRRRIHVPRVSMQTQTPKR